MAVRLEFESLDAAPEALRGACVEQDGKYVFEAEPAQEVSALKTALTKERDAAKQAKQALNKYKDIDPDRYAELVRLEHERADADLKAKGQIEELITQRIARAQAEWTAKEQQLTADLTARDAELNRVLIDNEIARIAPSCGVEDSAIDLVMMLARQAFRRQDGAVVAVNAQGNVEYGKDGKPLTMQEWFSELARQRPILFRKSTGSGQGNAVTSSGGTPRKPVKDWSPEEKRAFVDSNGMPAWERLVAEAYANPVLPGSLAKH